MLDLTAIAGKYKRVRLIQEFELPQYDGWDILAVVQEQAVQMLTDHVANPAKAADPHAYPDTVEEQVYHPTTATKLLVGQTEAGAIETLTAELDAARADATKAANQVLTTEREIDDLKQKLAKAEGARDTEAQAADRARRLHRELESKVDRMERDIANVRAHVGQAAWDQALADKTA